MKENTERACKDFSAIHCVFPAGNAVVAAVEVEEIVEAQWKDLGMPETLWHCHVKEFGPLIVSIDSYGRNYFSILIDVVGPTDTISYLSSPKGRIIGPACRIAASLTSTGISLPSSTTRRCATSRQVVISPVRYTISPI